MQAAPDPLSFGFLELRITLGEVVNALITVGVAWYIGKVIARRHDNQRASKDLVVDLCHDCIGKLADLHSHLESKPNAETKRTILRYVSAFSNAVLVLETACKNGNFEKLEPAVQEVRRLGDGLRSNITNPMAANTQLDLRAIEGEVTAIRKALVCLQLDVNK